jgi:hypothetical protein
MKTKNLSKVKGFEEYSDYSVTSDGDVISHKFGKDRVLKKSVNSSGYFHISLSSSGKQINVSIHVIVARAFVEGYSSELEVNHLDEDKTNNFYKNLNWLTHKQNMNYGTARNTRNGGAIGKPVAQITLNGKLVKIWKSATQADRQGGFHRQNISAVCLEKYKESGGFNWCFEEDLKDNLGKKVIARKTKKVLQLDKENNIIKIWRSATEAAKVEGFNQGNISSVCLGKLKTSGGFKWCFTY